MTRTALVTGAYGFVGRYVARELAAQGYEVYGIGHGAWSPAEFRRWGVSHFRTSDVGLAELIGYGCSPNLLVHCAGSGQVSYSFAQPHGDFLRSVSTTSAVLEFVRLVAPDCRLVIPSSASVYGSVADLPIPVSRAPRPISPYGHHKLFCERLASYYSEFFGVATAVVRLFSVYGNGLRKQLIWDACRKLSAGDTMFDGTGDERRDWLHVTDAASLLHAAGERASTNGLVVNGGTQIATRVGDVLEMVAAELQVDSLQFAGHVRRGDPTDYQAEISCARKLGWAPRVTLAEGIRSFVADFKSAHT